MNCISSQVAIGLVQTNIEVSTVLYQTNGWIYVEVLWMHQSAIKWELRWWLILCSPNVGGLGSIPGQGTRSHTTQLRVCMLELKKKKKKTDTTCCNWYVFFFKLVNIINIVCVLEIMPSWKSTTVNFSESLQHSKRKKSYYFTYLALEMEGMKNLRPVSSERLDFIDLLGVWWPLIAQADDVASFFPTV